MENCISGKRNVTKLISYLELAQLNLLSHLKKYKENQCLSKYSDSKPHHNLKEICLKKQNHI